MQDRNRVNAGFTLLELSVVLLIVAILLGISLPRFSNFFESDLEQETRKIASIIDGLRLQAILKGENYRLVFDTKNSQYQVFTVNPEDTSESVPHETYGSPIKLTPPVEISTISTEIDNLSASRFGFKKLEFDKIFGQQYEFRIDSSGFIDLFLVRLKDNKNSLTLRIKNIMGEMAIGQENPL